MILLKSNQLNKIVVTLTQNTTVCEPEYLFQFIHIFSKLEVKFILPDVSPHPTRYNQFEFIEGQGVGEIPFPYEGQYNYYAYAQPFGSGNLNPLLATELVENGIAEFIVVSADTTNENYFEFISDDEFNSNTIFAPDEINPPTPTQTPGLSPTPTPSITASATPTTTQTPTNTATPSQTPTNTATNTATPTNTTTQTPTPTPTATIGLSPTPTPSITPSATPFAFCYDVGTGFNNTSEFFVEYPSGEMVIGGQFNQYQGISKNQIVGLNSDASINGSFSGSGFGASVFNGVEQADGKIIVVGAFDQYDGTSIGRSITRLNTDGTLDNTFNTGSGFNGGANTFVTAVQADGKILVGGNFTSYSGVSYRNLIRLESDGSVDNTFNIGTGFTNDVLALAVQSDGKILVGGSELFAGEYGLVRLNTDGSKDTSFPTDAIGNGEPIFVIVINPDGKIMIGGDFGGYSGQSSQSLARLNTDGTFDNTFITGGLTSTIGGPFVTGISIIGTQYLITGAFNTVSGVTQSGITRLNNNGSIDNTFNSGTGFSPTGVSTATIFNKVLNNGVYAIFGEFTSYKGTTTNRLAFLSPSGTLMNCP
jgi:uncharacterized delta-60 repeat protein